VLFGNNLLQQGWTCYSASCNWILIHDRYSDTDFTAGYNISGACARFTHSLIPSWNMEGEKSVDEKSI